MVADRIEEAYRRLHPRLWHALYAYSGSPEIASDAESEAFTQALRRGEQIRDVDAWVWRSAFRIAAGLLEARPVPMDPSVVFDSLPSAVFPSQSHLAEFMSMLADLSDQQRAIVALRYVGDFRPNEIADLLTSSPGSVRVQLHRAHTQLRQALLTQEAEDLR